jgi:hypothetical protein
VERSEAAREDFRGRPSSAATAYPKALVVLAALGALALLWIDVPLCPTAALLGLPCPGCGLTRATLALLRGDAQTAFALHPMVFVAVPGLILISVASGARALGWRGGMPEVSSRSGSARAPRRPQMNQWIALGAALLIALLLAVWVARWFGAFGGPVPVDEPIWTRFTR